MQPSRRTSRFLLGVLVVLTISYCMISNRFLLPTPAPRDEGQLIERSETNRCNCAYVGGDEPKRIVSYSLFGDLKDRNIRERYYDQLARRLDEIAQRLPGSTSVLFIHMLNMTLHWEIGWKVRVYHNASADFVCPFECNKKHSGMVRFYNMNNPLNAQESQINPRLWRFLPLNDEPVVDALLTRDLDSEVSEREVAAVNEWLNSSYSFHVMRDHPFHQAFILAGNRLSNHKTTECNRLPYRKHRNVGRKTIPTPTPCSQLRRSNVGLR